jgi:transposase-like protein
MRGMLELLLTRVMEAEVSTRVAAERYEHAEERSGYRNGTRARRFDTRLGTVDLKVPKVRNGGYIPGFLDERSRSERALISVVQQRSTAVLQRAGLRSSSAPLGSPESRSPR